MIKSTLLCFVCMTGILLAQFKPDYVMFDTATHISRNYVRFLNTNNVYVGYDLTINPSNRVTSGTIDWSIGKMAEVSYTNTLGLVFTNTSNWVKYDLRLNGTNSVSWPAATVFLGVTVANSNHFYTISRYNDGTNYVFQYNLESAGGGSTNSVSVWANYIAIADVNVGSRKIIFADGTYLRGAGTNLYFGYTE
jgi:hypothetical protein